jgi:riboflavin transporter FmnP
MGAVGNVLGVIAISLGKIPNPGVSQVALDFSSLAVIVVAVFAGWRLGALTGLIAGIGPMIMFGYVFGSTGIITVFLPIGKALTGLSVGLISQAIGSNRKSRAPIVIATVLVGFVPEAVLTWFYFVNLVPFFVPGAFAGPTAATLVLVKAWAEMIIIAFLTVALIGNAGFRAFLGRLVTGRSVQSTKFG